MESLAEPAPSISMLLVEDEEETLRILAAILAKKFPDIALHVAVNGRMGLELFNEHKSDIVITDVNMPEMTGVQMIDKITAADAEAKIIVLTATTEKSDLEQMVKNGLKADRFILKPIDFGALFAAIEECLGEIAKRQLK